MCLDIHPTCYSINAYRLNAVFKNINILVQKKRELEEMAHNWPEEKMKGLAMEKILGELKKDETVSFYDSINFVS